MRAQTIATDLVALPELNADLWSHQRKAFAKAAALPGFLLAHDMGAGKSATTIALLEHDQAKRVLILCPTNVVGVWPAQLNGPLDAPAPAEGFSPRRWEVWAGRVMGARGRKRNPSVSERAAAMLRANTDAIKLGRPFAAVVNYEASHRGDMAALIRGTEWDALICDESHRLKLASGKASQLAAKVAAGVRARGGRVLCLTGTPMPHSPLDIWAQMRIVDGGERLFESHSMFCKRFGAAETIWTKGRGGQPTQRLIYKELRDDRAHEFHSLVEPVVDVVKARDVLDLPPVLPARHVEVELAPETRRAYEELEKHGITELDEGTLTAANAMVLVLRLAQVTSGFGKDAVTDDLVALNDGMPEKAEALAEVLEDLHPREPIVVFARFHADLDAIRRVAESQGRRYGELSGRARDGLTADSKMSPDVDVLGAQLKSGGVGIDLTRARIGVYYSQDFALADYQQSQARLHRPGQDRPVQFVYLLAKGTVDHAIYGALRHRREVVDAVIKHLQGRQS